MVSRWNITVIIGILGGMEMMSKHLRLAYKLMDFHGEGNVTRKDIENQVETETPDWTSEDINKVLKLVEYSASI